MIPDSTSFYRSLLGHATGMSLIGASAKSKAQSVAGMLAAVGRGQGSSQGSRWLSAGKARYPRGRCPLPSVSDGRVGAHTPDFTSPESCFGGPPRRSHRAGPPPVLGRVRAGPRFRAEKVPRAGQFRHPAGARSFLRRKAANRDAPTETCAPRREACQSSEPGRVSGSADAGDKSRIVNPCNRASPEVSPQSSFHKPGTCRWGQRSLFPP